LDPPLSPLANDRQNLYLSIRGNKDIERGKEFADEGILLILSSVGRMVKE
jgi:hypothetical protein